MKHYKRNITLPEGVFSVKVTSYELSDKKIIADIYNAWCDLNIKLRVMGSRGINLPEGISENSFCVEMNCVKVTEKIPKANTSWDCYDLSTGERIQIKACSVIPDLTSFGPSSQWDKLYFMDFYKKGTWDGSYDIYLIPNKMIYEYPVNKSETMKFQQGQNRRPRFSIWDGIIKKCGIKPIKTCNLIQ